MRDTSEKIDDICEESMGHTNWAFWSSMSRHDKKNAGEFGIRKTHHKQKLFFYYENICPECDNTYEQGEPSCDCLKQRE